MLRLVQPTLAAVVALSAASAVMAQGFSLNPFTKQEPADPGSVRRTASDARPAEKTSPFSLPKLSMPKMPKMSMPSLPKLPGMGAKPKPAKPASNQPSMLTKFNNGAKNFFGKTKDFVTAPFTSKPEKKTPAQLASSRNKKQSGGLFKLPTWLGGKPDPPPAPRSVQEFLAQPRPGFDR